MTPRTTATPISKLILGASLILIAFNLRPLFSSLSVLLPEIMAVTGLTATGATALTTLPLLCLGLFAGPAPALSRRFGAERVLFGTLLLIVAGALLRSLGTLPTLFIGTALAGVGIAFANVLLPSLVKRDFTQRSAIMTGLYTLAVCAGASSAAAFTVPLERHLFQGSWALALAFWSAPAALVALMWAPQALRARHDRGAGDAKSGSLWHSALAWQVTLFMGLQSALAFIVIGWLSPMLRERGLGASEAGYVVGASILAQLGTSLVTPSIAVRCRNQRGLAVGLAFVIVTSMLALLFAPLGGRWIWSVLLGCGQGGGFALALSLIVLRSPNAPSTAQLSAMAQGIGYLIAMIGPMLAGVLRSWTGSFRSAAALCVVFGLGMAWSGWGAGRSLMVHPTAG